MTKVRRIIGVLLLVIFFFFTQIPGYKTNAADSMDFQVSNGELIKYTGGASSVTIPFGVKRIGEEAFAGNTDLKSVSIGEGVKEIEYGAFRDCTNLTSVSLPQSLEIIGSAAFSNNTSLRRITLRGSVSSIGLGAFAGCDSLSSVRVDSDNQYFTVSGGIIYSKYMDTLVYYPSGLTADYFAMPSSVRKIAGYAFWGNHNLKEIVLSSSLDEISGYAFSNCNSLTKIVIPYSVGNIDAKAFENCISLKNVTIPASVSYIHETAFDGCPDLFIHADAGTRAYEFYENWKRRNQNSTVSTGSGTIVSESVSNSNTGNSQPVTNDTQSNDSLEQSGDTSGGTVYVVGSNGQITAIDKNPQGTTNRSTAGSNSTVVSSGNSTVVSSGTIDAMNHPSNVDAIPAGNPLDVVEEGVLGKTIVVGHEAVVLMDSSALRVNSGATYRGVSSEEETEALQSFVDEEKGTALPKYTIIDNRITAHAYYGSSDLTGYSIPAGIAAIGDFAFARSTLTEITIPEGVKEIGYAAFYHCDHLATVNIPDSVTWIEPSAFTYTAWLNNWGSDQSTDDFLIVGDGILLAYKGSSPSVIIPEGVKTIAPAAFIGHNEIQSVTLPTTLRVIGEEAFTGCSLLTTLEGGSSLTQIQDRAFQNTALTEVRIADTVKTIGVGAFASTDVTTQRTVIFEGSQLPVLSYTDRSMHVSNTGMRIPAFSGNWKAVVASANVNTTGTVLEEGKLGFTGRLVTRDGSGTERILREITMPSQGSLGIRITSGVEQWPAECISASIPYEGEFHLSVQPGVRSQMEAAFTRIYGQNLPGMMVFDMAMTDYTGSVSLTRFGTRPLEVTVPLPDNISGSDVHVVTLDEDGQLELLSSTLIQQVNEGAYVRFSTTHLSPFAIYAMGEGDSRIIEDGTVTYTAVSGKKDYSPNTGDNSIPPRWFIAVGTLSIAVILILCRPKKNRRQ